MRLFYYTPELNLDAEYKSLLKAYYGGRFEKKWQRYLWYLNSGKLSVLVAEIDGKLVGQSCAYKCNLKVGGKISNIAWGVDNFVFSEYRGKGIGKALQRKLHEDFYGFSSASYSRANEHIKKKCGAHPIAIAKFYYYPLSCFFSFYLSLGVYKTFRKHIPVLKIPNLYVPFKAEHAEISVLTSWEDEHIDFVNHVLNSRYDLFVCRDRDYMNWKYSKNPSITYDILDIKVGGERVAMIGMSKPYENLIAGLKLKTVKLFDFFVRDSSKLSDRQVMGVLKRWLVKMYDKLDLIIGLNDIPVTYRIKWHEREFLTNLDESHVASSPYISAMDQDIEQMN